MNCNNLEEITNQFIQKFHLSNEKVGGKKSTKTHRRKNRRKTKKRRQNHKGGQNALFFGIMTMWTMMIVFGLKHVTDAEFKLYLDKMNQYAEKYINNDGRCLINAYLFQGLIDIGKHRELTNKINDNVQIQNNEMILFTNIKTNWYEVSKDVFELTLTQKIHPAGFFTIGIGRDFSSLSAGHAFIIWVSENGIIHLLNPQDFFSAHMTKNLRGFGSIEQIIQPQKSFIKFIENCNNFLILYSIENVKDIQNPVELLTYIDTTINTEMKQLRKPVDFL